MSPLISNRSKRLKLVGLTMLLLVGSLLCMFFYSDTLEDAYITFRYSEHLAAGHGPGAWNIGDAPVEGYTTFLWMLLLAAGKLLGISTLTSSKLLGWLSLLGLVGLLFRADRFLRSSIPEWDWSTAGILTAVWIVGYLPLTWYAVSGMESMMYIFMLTATTLLAVRNKEGSWWDLAFACLLVLTRPEGILPAMIILLGLALHRWRGGTSLRRALYRPVLLALFQLILIVFRMAYFGYPFPNAYYAKVAGGGWNHVALGLDYIYDAIRGWRYWFPLALYSLALVVCIRRKRCSLPLISWLTIVPLTMIFVAKTGGDNPSAFPYIRHLLHILPLMLLPGLAALAGWNRMGRTLAAALTVVGVIVMDLPVLSKPGPVKADSRTHQDGTVPISAWFKHEPPKELIRWIGDQFPRDTRIAVALGGELPYYTDFYTIDMLGLSNEQIAHHGTFQGDVVDSKSDMTYVMSLRPDLIESTVDANDLLRGLPHKRHKPWRGVMEDAMIDDETFRREYLFVSNAPYESWPRALFVRRDFWESLPNRDQISTVPVEQTPLYTPAAEVK